MWAAVQWASRYFAVRYWSPAGTVAAPPVGSGLYWAPRYSASVYFAARYWPGTPGIIPPSTFNPAWATNATQIPFTEQR